MLRCLCVVKAKLSLVLKQALRHADVDGSGGITPRFLNLGTRWM
jgi:hypothetical protein